MIFRHRFFAIVLIVVFLTLTLLLITDVEAEKNTVHQEQQGVTTLLAAPLITTSFPAIISGNGQFAVFPLYRYYLGLSDQLDWWDVFVYDRQTGQATRVSVSSSGVPGNGGSYEPAISADGQVVAFTSWASNLVPNDTSPYSDIFVHNRTTGEIRRVSVSSNGEQGNRNSFYPAISADGQVVAFVSWADNLVTGVKSHNAAVFVYDFATQQTTRVSVSSQGDPGFNKESSYPVLSADGRYVAFESWASLVENDTNETADIFVHDRQTGQTERVSISSTGEQANVASFKPSISADGQIVAFESSATNLIEGGTNGQAFIAVHDRQTGETTMASVSSTGEQSSSIFGLDPPKISANGRFVAFTTDASNLVENDTNGKADVFVHDRQTGQTIRISVSSTGEQGDDDSWLNSISDDGQVIGFGSGATNLDPNESDEGQMYRGDAFVHELQASAIVTPTPTTTIPVILVHGNMDDASSWDTYIHQYLASINLQGFAVDTLDTNGNKHHGRYTNTIAENAQELAIYIDKIRQQTHADKVAIVAHSMGGLITRKYIDDHPQDHHIYQLIMLGTPNGGSVSAEKGEIMYLTFLDVISDPNSNPVDIAVAEKGLELLEENSLPPALFELTPSYMKLFNVNNPKPPDVPFYGVAGNVIGALCLIKRPGTLPIPTTVGNPLEALDDEDKVNDMIVGRWSVQSIPLNGFWTYPGEQGACKAAHTKMRDDGDDGGGSEIFHNLVKPLLIGSQATSEINKLNDQRLRGNATETPDLQYTRTLIDSMEPGETKELTITVEPATKAVLSVLSPPNLTTVELRTPNGELITSDTNNPAVEYLPASTDTTPFDSYVILDPLAGVWQIIISSTTQVTSTFPVAATLAVSSSLPVHVESIVPTTTLTLSSPVIVAVSVKADALPVTGSSVYATIHSLSSTFASMVLYDDGKHSDGTADDGIYANTFIPTQKEIHAAIINVRGVWQQVLFERNALWLADMGASSAKRNVYLPLIKR